MNIETRMTAPRGCGLRKPGGLYLVAGAPAAPCGKLPLPLTICPCCGAGIKFARSWTWVDADKLFATIPNESCACRLEGRPGCGLCPAAIGNLGRAGLLWIGERFYPTTAGFSAEAARQGISRRIKAVPHGFQVGSTWVLFAHIKAIRRIEVVVEKLETGMEDRRETEVFNPGIFMLFRPTAIEYVVKGDEPEEELQKLVDRGITPVRDQLPAGEGFDPADGDIHSKVIGDDDE